MRSSRVELREPARVALDALSQYRLRTCLSVVGVVLGVSATVAMLSVSEGAAREALQQVDSLGLDNLIVRSHVGSGSTGVAPGLAAGDAERVAALLPGALSVSPLVERSARVARGGRAREAPVLGVGPAYARILRLRVQRGRFLAFADDRSAASVCVLGASLARSLFALRDPVGQVVRVDDAYYRVVGVLEARGSPGSANAMAWRDTNEVAMVPLASLTGRGPIAAPTQAIDEIWIQVERSADVTALGEVLQHAVARVRATHEGFGVVVPRELLAQRQRTQRTFATVIGSVAVLALLVGGIGIMNIMLTSVVERTREIGIRRAGGARRRDIALQFLIEALVMTTAGGLIGVAGGVAASWAITAYAGWSTSVSPSAIVLAFAVSFSVGVIFGSYPAVRAARLDPVDALRYE